MPTQFWLRAAGVGLAICVLFLTSTAHAQFEAPANSLALEDTGTVEAIQGNVVKYRDSKNEVWLLTMSGDTTLAIEGEAGPDYLRPGLTVEIAGEVDDEGSLKEPVKEVTVLDPKSKPTVGLFAKDDNDPDAKPVRSPKPGAYRIRGKLTMLKSGEFLIAAGRSKIAGNLGDEVKVKLAIDDASAAQFGDAMKVKAWYYDQGKPNPTLNRPGQAIAEEIHITLSEAPTGKRPRAGLKAIKSARTDKAAKE